MNTPMIFTRHLTNGDKSLPKTFTNLHLQLWTIPESDVTSYISHQASKIITVI